MTADFPFIPTPFDRDVERLATPIEHPAEALVDPPMAGDIRALLALTDTVERHGAGEVRIVAREDDYAGDHKEYVLAPFAHPTESRFSDGSYGVLYAGLAAETALRESVYWLTRFFRDGAMPAGVIATKIQLTLRACAEVADVRTASGGIASIYDPDDYLISRRCGTQMRELRHDGIWYDSVRHRGGECLGLFVPRVVNNVRIASRLELQWDGARFGAVKTVRAL